MFAKNGYEVHSRFLFDCINTVPQLFSCLTFTQYYRITFLIYRYCRKIKTKVIFYRSEYNACVRIFIIVEIAVIVCRMGVSSYGQISTERTDRYQFTYTEKRIGSQFCPVLIPDFQIK